MPPEFFTVATSWTDDICSCSVDLSKHIKEAHLAVGQALMMGSGGRGEGGGGGGTMGIGRGLLTATDTASRIAAVLHPPAMDCLPAAALRPVPLLRASPGSSRATCPSRAGPVESQPEQSCHSHSLD